MIRLVPILRSVVLGAGLVAGLGAALAQQAPPAQGPTSDAELQKVISATLTDEHLAIAADVLKASGMKTMFTNSLPNVVGALRVNVTRQRPELAKDIEASLKVVEDSTDQVINDGLKGAARFLAYRMSEGELKEVLAFMTSPVGKKYVDALPPFMEQIVPYLQVWSQTVGGRLTDIFQKEMANRGHKL